MATEHRSDVRPGGWGNRDFYDEVARPRRLLERGATSAIVCAGAFLVMLLAITHENHDCGLACSDGDGILPYQGGHAWTAYQDAWQWQAQWVLGIGGLVLGLAALAASTRFALRRWTLVLNALAVGCALSWIAWRLLEPPIPT
ncbi:hypothetical protein DSM104299_02880 [Baekduia alba]|uniref:hypothetical protein n=1 Tax=Baekduia alba TaxID=2997333 RepID=UPI002341618A|nr:hypothetical protein [Baekduia alba]WCB94152.1 hypothetical protein DSM104299_02880 [Baekduia alba]